MGGLSQGNGFSDLGDQVHRLPRLVHERDVGVDVPGPCSERALIFLCSSPAQGHAPLCLGRAGLPEVGVDVRIGAGAASCQGLWNPANPLGVRRREAGMLGERALNFLCSGMLGERALNFLCSAVQVVYAYQGPDCVVA